MFAEMLFRDFCFDIKCVTLTFILLGHWEDNAAMFMLEKKHFYRKKKEYL